jgi:uncharacterized protein YndB with AHSA1/START domain
MTWTREETIEAAATRDAVWRLWSDVERWGEWNAGVAQIEIDGPFATGSAITMTPPGDEPVHLRLTDVVPGEQFVDEARFGGTVITTTHRLEPGAEGSVRIVYRMEIDGPGGAGIGPAISADFPDVLAALAARAEAA